MAPTSSLAFAALGALVVAVVYDAWPRVGALLLAVVVVGMLLAAAQRRIV